MKPKIEDNRKGVVVKEVIPSIAKLNKLKKFQEDLPATLSFCSKSTEIFLNPIQQNMPLVYLSDSLKDLSASIQHLSNSLKSPTF